MGEATEGPRRKRYAIGIDPPGSYAAFNLETRVFDKLATVGFWGVIEALDSIRECYDITVFCEAPQKNPPVWLGRTRHGARELVNERALMKAAQNVGQNKQCAILIVEWCKRNGVEIVEQRPTKSSFTKIDAETFSRITGWKGKSNEHTRDAGMLAFQQYYRSPRI